MGSSVEHYFKKIKHLSENGGSSTEAKLWLGKLQGSPISRKNPADAIFRREYIQEATMMIAEMERNEEERRIARESHKGCDKPKA
jgi:hypothetical protein